MVVEHWQHYDQWTVPNGLDPHRPLYRIALNDGQDTELYVSSTTGEVVRDTTRARAMVELRRQRAALDLSDRAAQPLGGVGSRRSGGFR